MTRAVFDTNVFVSALLVPTGTPADILNMALDGKIELILSHRLLDEIVRVLQYPHLKKRLEKAGAGLDEIRAFLEMLIEASEVVPGDMRIKAVSDEPSDDMVLACAVEGRADVIISGDQHLKALKMFRGIAIVTPRAFLDDHRGLYQGNF